MPTKIKKPKPRLITAEEHIAMQEQMYRRVMKEVVTLMESAQKPTEEEKRESQRDFFASQAIVGILSRSEVFLPDRFSDMAFEVADAMLKARITTD